MHTVKVLIPRVPKPWRIDDQCKKRLLSILVTRDTVCLEIEIDLGDPVGNSYLCKDSTLEQWYIYYPGTFLTWQARKRYGSD